MGHAGGAQPSSWQVSAQHVSPTGTVISTGVARTVVPRARPAVAGLAAAAGSGSGARRPAAPEAGRAGIHAREGVPASGPAPHIQSRISGRSWPCLSM